VCIIIAIDHQIGQASTSTRNKPTHQQYKCAVAAIRKKVKDTEYNPTESRYARQGSTRQHSHSTAESATTYMIPTMGSRSRESMVRKSAKPTNRGFMTFRLHGDTKACVKKHNLRNDPSPESFQQSGVGQVLICRLL
jgi:hypothetical protein